MGDFPPGTQARIRGFEGDAEANGRICVSIACANDRVTARLATGRELSVPLSCLQRVAKPGSLPAGARVRLSGLAKAPELNGRSAVVEDSTVHPAGRLLVNLGTGPAKALKFENLVLIDSAGACGSGGFARGVKVAVKGHVDPGYNGLEGIVLDGDCNDSGRLLVMLPAVGRCLSLGPSNCTATGTEATSYELAALGPPLKEAFYTEVRKFLWGVANERTSLHLLFGADATARGNPYSPESRVYAGWTSLCAACGDQAQTIREVLRERTLFELVPDPRGFESVALTPAGRQMNISEGLPEPPSKRKKVEEDTGKQKEDEFARILYSALHLCATKGKFVSISKIGSDVRVMELRKDPQFEKKKLVDILHAYPNVFELEAEAPPSSGWTVRLKEDAEIALPMRKAGEAAPMASGDVLPDPEEALLPDKILEPEDMKARIQALRIELIHALQRRTGKADMGSLGMEPGVQKIRREMGRGRPLMEVIRIFPKNFQVEDTRGKKPQVKLCSKDVEDMAPLENWMRKYRSPPRGENGKRGRGKRGRSPPRSPGAPLHGQQPGPPPAGYAVYPQMGYPGAQFHGYPPQGYPVAQPCYGCPAPVPGYAAPGYGYAMPAQQAPPPVYGHAQYPQPAAYPQPQPQPQPAYAQTQPAYAQPQPVYAQPQPAYAPAPAQAQVAPGGYAPAPAQAQAAPGGYAGAPAAYGHYPAAQPAHASHQPAPGYAGYAGHAGYAPPQQHGGGQAQWQ